MKLLFELDTISLEVKVISRQDITEKDIIKDIADYFNIDSAEKSMGKGDAIILARQFTIYFLRELFGTDSRTIRNYLGYEDTSSIIATSLNKLSDLLFDQKDPHYVRPYNNLLKRFANYGIVLKPIILDQP